MGPAAAAAPALPAQTAQLADTTCVPDCRQKEKVARRAAQALRWGPPPPSHLHATIAGELAANVASSATFAKQRLQQLAGYLGNSMAHFKAKHAEGAAERAEAARAQAERRAKEKVRSGSGSGITSISQLAGSLRITVTPSRCKGSSRGKIADVCTSSEQSQCWASALMPTRFILQVLDNLHNPKPQTSY